jgi:hypothetical protein
MSNISLNSALPNLYALNASRTSPVLSEGRLADVQRPSVDLSEAAPARSLPDNVVISQEAVRYTSAQLEMKPVDRADAALMHEVQPESFEALRQALLNDGDWQSLLADFVKKIPNNPLWQGDAYWMAAGDFLQKTGYLLNLRAGPKPALSTYQ